jgi:hypothetical protein
VQIDGAHFGTRRRRSGDWRDIINVLNRRKALRASGAMIHHHLGMHPSGTRLWVRKRDSLAGEQDYPRRGKFKASDYSSEVRTTYASSRLIHIGSAPR